MEKTQHGSRHAEKSRQATPAIADPKHGQGVLVHIEERKHDLEAALARLQGAKEANPGMEAIEMALNELDSLMPADIANITPVNAAELSRWLDSSRHLAEHPGPAHRGAAH